MASFPTTLPPNVTEIRDYIRLWLGDLSVSYITDEVMDVFINLNITKYTDNLCKITFYSTLDILGWLIRESAKGSSGSAGTGAVKKRLEESGTRKIEVQYDVGVSGGVSSSWETVRDDLLENPSRIGCNPIDSSEKSSTGNVVIGGISKSEADRVNADPDTRNGYNENPRETLNRYPSYRKHPRNPFGY